jgi:hypothetical protein
MIAEADGRSGAHFSSAGILTSLSMILGVGYLMTGLAVPSLPPSPLILTLLALAAASIIFSTIQSVRMIGRKLSIGWVMLLGNCFYAIVLTPLLTIHGMIALETVK